MSNTCETCGTTEFNHALTPEGWEALKKSLPRHMRNKHLYLCDECLLEAVVQWESYRHMNPSGL